MRVFEVRKPPRRRSKRSWLHTRTGSYQRLIHCLSMIPKGRDVREHEIFLVIVMSTAADADGGRLDSQAKQGTGD